MSQPRTHSAIEAIIRPVVEGQIRGFLKEHPGIVDAVDWYKPRKDKALTFTNSLSKRIVRDLCSANFQARMRAALVENWSAAPSGLPVALNSAGDGGASGTATGRATQSRTHSAIEAATNVIVGLAVAMGVQYAVFPMFGIQISHSDHFAIAAFFVVASIIRSYALRRLFNRWHSKE